MRGQVQVDARFIVNLLIITLLLVAALTLATRFGFIQCNQIPYWCEGYHRIMGAILGRTYPAVLVLYGDDGMGDPKLLRDFIYHECHIYTDLIHIRNISSGNLSNYDVVIVEKAKRMRGEQLGMLWDYLANGGRLIFVADSGTEGDDILKEENKPINPWDRETDEEIIRFGRDVLGLRYVGNYCDECEEIYAYLESSGDALTAGVGKVPITSNFAVVEEYGSSLFGLQYRSASIDGVSEFNGIEPPFPGIVRVGYRIIYFAVPPEVLLTSGTRGSILLYNLCDYLQNV